MEAKYSPGDVLTVRVRVREVIISKDNVEYGVETPRTDMEVSQWLGRVEERDVINKCSE